MHHVMILDKWPILFYVFISIYNSLHVSSTSCSSSGETNCVNTASGSCHSVSVSVSCAGRKLDRQGVTATRGCIDTICLSWWWALCARNMYRVKNKNKSIKKTCTSGWSFTKNHYVMHGPWNIKYSGCSLVWTSLNVRACSSGMYSSEEGRPRLVLGRRWVIYVYHLTKRLWIERC
jgi:hypothetical protein